MVVEGAPPRLTEEGARSVLVCERDARERRRGVFVRAVRREIDTWGCGVEKARIWPKDGGAHA